MVRKIYNCEEGCSVESTLQLISGRWKSVLLYHLIFEGEHRYMNCRKKSQASLAECSHCN